jgi:thiazole synthase
MISIRINGEHRRVREGLSLAALASELGFVPEKIAVERNLEVVPRSTLAQVMVEDGDELEIVHFVGGGDHAATRDDTWTVAGKTFHSRLIVGTGKYKRFAQNAAAVEASGAEIVTVAVRRVNISDPNAPMLTDFIDPKKITYLPNTAGCFTAEDAIRTLRLAREAGGWDLVKLEVLGEARTLYPDMRRNAEARLRGACQAKASCRWSIASMIRLPRSSWKARVRWRSCRWAHRSARAWVSRTG